MGAFSLKKVLFVIPYLQDGGTERALSNITMNWPADWEIDILVNSKVRIDYEYQGNVISLGIDKKKKVNSLIFQLNAFIKRVRKLRRLKKENNYVACISFLDSTNLANIITKTRKCKTIISIRTSIASSAKNKWQYRYVVCPIAKVFYNKADKVVAVSEELKYELIDIFGIRENILEVVQNGYDVPKIQKDMLDLLTESEMCELSGKQMIFAAGRLSKEKYFWHLIRAMKLVVKEIPSAILWIAGSGALEKYLLKIIEASDLCENVKILGHVSNVYKYESHSKVFVIPSGWEGFPNALVEAMCVGVPCIATDFKTGAREILAPELLDCGDKIQEIYRGSYGIITPVCSGTLYEGDEPLEKSEIFLAEALIGILKDEKLREEYHKKSIERGIYFGINETVNKWIEVIS